MDLAKSRGRKCPALASCYGEGGYGLRERFESFLLRGGWDCVKCVAVKYLLSHSGQPSQHEPALGAGEPARGLVY